MLFVAFELLFDISFLLSRIAVYTYVDAAYCYQPTIMVYRSVILVTLQKRLNRSTYRLG